MEHTPQHTGRAPHRLGGLREICSASGHNGCMWAEDVQPFLQPLPAVRHAAAARAQDQASVVRGNQLGAAKREPPKTSRDQPEPTT